jgi:hypothetical protein
MHQPEMYTNLLGPALQFVNTANNRVRDDAGLGSAL